MAPDEIRILGEKIRGFPRREYFLLNCIEVSKEKRIFISLILFRCAKRSILPQKTKTSENESEVFRVKIPQHKVTKCNTYKNSLFFTIVSLQFSRKLYYSGCLTSPNNLLKNFLLTNCRFRIVRKKKKYTSQMRLGSVFKMRTSIINTATIEQMGCIIFSFFVYTKSTNSYFPLA